MLRLIACVITTGLKSLIQEVRRELNNVASVVVTVITGRYRQVLQAIQPHLSPTQEGTFKAQSL